VALIGSLVAVGLRADSADRRVLWGWIGFVIVIQGWAQLWANLPARFDPARSLPLHICDVVPWIGCWAILRGSSLSRALTYYWGVGLSVWAFIMPILNTTNWSLEYWLFWLGHAQILATAAYLLWVQGYRPTWSDFRLAAVATLGYGSVVLLVNAVLGADYGYLGRRPPAVELGPWPARVPILIALEIGLFALLTMPWTRRASSHLSGQHT